MFYLILLISLGFCHVYAKNPIIAYFEQKNTKSFFVQSLDQSNDNFTCTPDISQAPECYYHGTCQKDGNDCICDNGYTTSNHVVEKCDYKQKVPSTAFLLELFLGPIAGAGYFYLGLINLAVGQLCLFWIGIIPGIIIMHFVPIIAYGYQCLWAVGIIVWWIIALVGLANGSYRDGNGILVNPL